jgi:hypothetical protein
VESVVSLGVVSLGGEVLGREVWDVEVWGSEVWGCVTEAGCATAPFVVARLPASPSMPLVVEEAAGFDWLPCLSGSEVALLFGFDDGVLGLVSGPSSPAADVVLDDGPVPD